MEEKLLQLRLQVEYLTSCVSRLHEVVDDLEEDKDELIDENGRLGDRLEDLEDDYDDLRDDYREVKDTLRELEDNYAELRDESLEVSESKALRTLRYDYDAMVAKCRKIENERDRIRDERDQIQHERDTLKVALSTHQMLDEATEKERNRFRAERDALRIAVSTQQMLDEANEKERNRFRAERDALRITLSTQQTLEEANEREHKLAQIDNESVDMDLETDNESEAMELDPLPGQTVAVAHLPAEYWKLSEQLARANSLAALKEPLFRVGVAIRLRFWEKQRAAFPPLRAIQLALMRGNAAAHSRDCLADQSLFKLGFMGSPRNSQISLLPFADVNGQESQIEDHDRNLFRGLYNRKEYMENKDLFNRMYGCDHNDNLSSDKVLHANTFFDMPLAP
ncbi:hypothetical protein GLAREA_11116 [Glarea lozoyensis ATCC 20868]|uniref:Uncharacterized protein n=1 Tax=Glarea lozoyensis (strain ATCC 20868 / MF5171) TaxID=1116229 RepID=S3DAD7_GLAL2|nr:uncharacterized protein GLAREA_11116 [Glarea lozoyensis ATCC 20868]EPE35417.1 hypothetical protein GLAREA_11116 [Glarea lozoyensis ATCC 20868]